jgi:hypothetical protein
MNPLLAIVLREKGSQAVVVIGVRPRDPQVLAAWLMLQAVILIPAQGQILEDDEIAFLREHAPRVLEIAKEAERENYREVLEEVKERVEELQGEWEEAKGDGESWAKLMVGEMANETALEFLVWKFEEEKIVEAAAEGQLRTLMEEQLKIHNGIARQEIAWAKKEGEKEEAAELAEELEWRMKNPRRAVDELMAEFLRDMEAGEEDEDDDVGEDEPEGEVYTPPPARKEITSELEGVTYDYDQHIVTTLETYCFDCHDKATAKGDLDLETALAETPLVRNRLLWENVAERVKNGDMPPAKKAQPKERDRLRVRAWLAREIDHFDYSTVRNPGYLPARRLTREEYNRTIRDLVGLDLRPADQFPMDFSGTSGFSNSANTLFLATAHFDRYLTSAELVIDAVRKDSKAWNDLIKGVPAEEALEGFVRRAYRRPPSQKEMSELRDRFAQAKKAGKSEQEALAEVFKVVLISPHFLLRVEEGGEAGVDVAVGPFDYATRLSYFLWASTPDSELLNAAARGELSSATRRNEFITAMLADPRSRALGDIFAGEWLGTHNVGPRIRKDPIDNPWCTESLMAAMRNETAYFVHSLILDDAPVARLIDAEYTYLNSELARFYRISGVKGDEMRRVKLETDQRGGVLGHASVLAATSFPERTSPVVRGTWILTTLLGTPPPPPPPDVPEIEVEGRSRKAVRTLRQKLERHRESKKCAGCHSQIDPLGFALENYAEFGQWRGGVDNRGTLPNGAKFRGPAGLKIALKETRLDELGTQVIRKMLAYGLGRQLEYYDEVVVREIAAKLKPAGYPLGEMVREIASSYSFTTKRLPGKSESNKPAKP